MTENDPKPIPRKTPKKKGDGPSMREQILARKRAEAAANASSAKEATEQPEAKPAAKKAAPKASGRPARSSSGRTGGRSSARRGGEEGEGGERKSKRTRRERPQKKKSPVPLIATVAIVVVGAVLAFVFLGGEEEPAGGSTETAGAAEAAEGTSAGGSPEGAAAPAEEGADAAPSEDASPPAEEEAGEPADAEETPAPEKTAKPAEPEPVDLSSLEPFGKPEGATDEQWAKLQEDAALFFDVDAGAAGGRARRRLEEAGKLAWPAILNEMIKLDPANPEDNEQGMLAQRALNVARGSQTSQAFDWRTPDDGVLSEKNLRYNRKLIKALYDSWAKVVEDPSHWERIDKAEAAAEAKADTEKKIEDEFEFDPSDLEGLDG